MLYKMKQTIEQTLEREKLEFNSLDSNNQRAVACFIIDKSRNPENGVCGVCERAYDKRFCTLCEYIITNLNPLEIYNKLTNKKIKGIV